MNNIRIPFYLWSHTNKMTTSSSALGVIVTAVDGFSFCVRFFRSFNFCIGMLAIVVEVDAQFNTLFSISKTRSVAVLSFTRSHPKHSIIWWKSFVADVAIDSKTIVFEFRLIFFLDLSLFIRFLDVFFFLLLVTVSAFPTRMEEKEI